MEESSSLRDEEERDADPLIPKGEGDDDQIAVVEEPSDVVIPCWSALEILEEDGNGDLEAGSAPCCRICLECDGEDDDELISPCMCKGSQEFVHRSCLDHWRSVKASYSFNGVIGVVDWTKCSFYNVM